MTDIKYQTVPKKLLVIEITDKDYRYEVPQNVNGEELMRKLSWVFKDLASKNEHLSKLLFLASLNGTMKNSKDLIEFRDYLTKLIENAPDKNANSNREAAANH